MKLIILCLLSLNTYALSKYTLLSENPSQTYYELKNYELDVLRPNKINGEIIVFDEDLESKKLKTQYSIIKKEEGRPFSQKSFLIGEYYNNSESIYELQKLQQRYPENTKLINLNDWLGFRTTVNGNSLYALKVGLSNEIENTKKKAVFIGQHHARELMTHHTVIDLAKDLLLKIKLKDPTVLKQLNTSSIWFVPVVNPDGLDFVFDENNWWRKNRSRNLDKSFGVDLNRNYEFGWGKCGSNSSRGSSDIFKGLSPFSEIETRIMDKLNEKMKFQFLISFHSSGNEVLYPYKCDQLSDAAIYNDIRDRLAKKLNFGKRYASSSGEDFEHHFNQHGSISFLLEIGTSFQPSFSTYKNTVFPNVKKSMDFILNELNRNFLTVKVVDSKGRPVKGAKVDIISRPLLSNEQRVTDEWGYLRRLLSPSEYQVKIESNDGKKKSVMIKVGKKEELVTIVL